MTETLQRPPASSALRRRLGARQGPRSRSLPVAGALAALLAAVLGLVALAVPVLLVWASDARSGASAVEALRAGGHVWLVAHGVPLDVPDGRLSLAPLGLLALPLWLLWRAGASVSREAGAGSLRAAARAALAVAVPYAALTTGVGAATAGQDVRPSLVSAPLAGLAVALVGAGAGALRPAGLWRSAQRRLGARTRRSLPAVAAATGVLAAGGALLAAASLAVHASRAADLAAATAPGPVGGAALLLVGLALVPNAVVYAVAWLAGPGFAVGAGTSVGPFGHELGPVPSLPLLAALPDSGVPEWCAVLALLVPLGAGALVGRMLWRAGGAAASLRRVLVDVAATAVGCGAVWAVLAALSAGAAGGDRLSAVGPSPWAVGAAVGAEVALGAFAAVLVLRRR